MSSASCSPIGQLILSAWASGSGTCPTGQQEGSRTRCSPFSASVDKVLMARRGLPAAPMLRAFVTSSAPSTGETRKPAELVGHALRGLENGMEVVLDDQLGPAVEQDVLMNPPLAERDTQAVGALLRLGQRCGLLRARHQPVLAERQTGECEGHVPLGSQPLEARSVSDPPSWAHRLVEERHDVVAELPLVLVLDERVVESLPLRECRGNIWDAALPRSARCRCQSEAACRLPRQLRSDEQPRQRVAEAPSSASRSSPSPRAEATAHAGRLRRKTTIVLPTVLEGQGPCNPVFSPPGAARAIAASFPGRRTCCL